ncbi:MAG: SoxR reducing system RseC family protein [Caldiserica bacterium]|nr:SoxR reducing system RseC family protein [Caldisericota bacterium]
MRIEVGEVENIRGGWVRIKLGGSSACGECKLCGNRGDEKILEIPDPGNLEVGDRVKLSVPEGRVAAFSLLSFGLPLVFLLVGAALGFSFFKQEGLQVLSALGMFIIGVFIAMGISRSKWKKTVSRVKILEVAKR